MAKGLIICVQVKAKATKILCARGATQEFGKQASKLEMHGEIVRKEGAGPATKWLVRWDKPQSESAWNACSLTREADNVADEGLEDSTNGESSDSDEAPDVVDANPMVEHVAPADNPVAAAVENPLVVDGIPSITADHFDGIHHSMRIHDLPVITKSDYDFFLVMFPTQKLRDFASWTSLTLLDAGQMAEHHKSFSK